MSFADTPEIVQRDFQTPRKDGSSAFSFQRQFPSVASAAAVDPDSSGCRAVKSSALVCSKTLNSVSKSWLLALIDESPASVVWVPPGLFDASNTRMSMEPVRFDGALRSEERRVGKEGVVSVVLGGGR